MALAEAVTKLANAHWAIILANHPRVVTGRDLGNAVYAADELEKIAKLHPLLRRYNFRPLTAEQAVESGKAFSS